MLYRLILLTSVNFIKYVKGPAHPILLTTTCYQTLRNVLFVRLHHRHHRLVLLKNERVYGELLIIPKIQSPKQSC